MEKCTHLESAAAAAAAASSALGWKYFELLSEEDEAGCRRAAKTRSAFRPAKRAPERCSTAAGAAQHGAARAEGAAKESHAPRLACAPL